MKIVGIILLVILALILFVLFSILFVPIRYQISASAHSKQYSGEAKAHWFLHLLHLYVKYDKELMIRYGYLWMNKDPFAEEEDLSEHQSEQKETISTKATIQEDLSKDIEQTNISENVEKDTTNLESEMKPSKKKKSKKKGASIKARFHELQGKWKNFKHNYRKYTRMIEDERNKKAVHHLKEEVLRLLKAICPKSMKCTATFSTGSPDTTGQVLGILACFPIMYQNRWKISPDFESSEFYIEGDTNLIGKIYLYKIIGIAFRIWRDKNCRRLYRQLSR